MDKEVLIIIRVDGVEKEIKSVSELKQAVKELGDKQKETADKTSFFGEKLKGIKEFFGDLKNDAKGLQNDFVGFAKGLRISEKAAKGLAVGLSALGLPILLAAIAAIIEYFKNFEAGMKLVQTATNAFNAALGQLTASFEKLLSGDFKGFINGIFGIGDAVADSAAATDKLFTATKALLELEAKNAEVNAKLNAELERNLKVIEDGTATYEERVAALRKVEEVEKQLLENKRQEILLQKQILTAQLANENNYKEQLEIKKQISNLDAELVKTESELELKRGEADKKIRELDIERTNKAREEAEKRRQIEEKFQNDKVKLAQEIELLEITNDKDREKRRIEFELQNQLEAINQLEISEDKKGQLRVQTQQKYDLILKGLADKALDEDKKRIDEILKSQEVKKIETLAQKKEELKAEEQKLLDELTALGASDDKKKALKESFIKKNNDLEIEGRNAVNEVLKQLDLQDIENVFEKARIEIQAEEDKALKILDINGANDDEVFALKEKFRKKRDKLAQDEADFQAQLDQENFDKKLQLVSNAFGDIATLVGENSRLGKAAAVGQALINTFQAITTAQANLPPPFSFIASAAAAASGFAAVRKIVETKVPGDNGGGGGGGNVPSISLRQPAAFDPSSALNGVNLGPTEMTLAQNQPLNVKAYVVSSEMTTEQEKDRKINNISKL